jgi:hypothetical protein
MVLKRGGKFKKNDGAKAESSKINCVCGSKTGKHRGMEKENNKDQRLQIKL